MIYNTIMGRIILTALVSATSVLQLFSQDVLKDSAVKATPVVNGTIRGKYECQPQESEGRFEVRTARISVSGEAVKRVEYKAEIDLCDEGKIKMLDAFVKMHTVGNASFSIGQMRVPFTIDAHRSPHQQFFANRSFIAKQVGNVRDVGAMIGYRFGTAVPVTVEAGLFNGSGLTNQKDFWTRHVNFSAKVRAGFTPTANLVLSVQKIRPDSCGIMMYDAGINQKFGKFFVEAEYLLKTYRHTAFKNVHAADVFGCYDIPLRNCFFSKVSPLVRYDYMSDHSDGTRYLDGKESTNGRLTVNDYERSRLTIGTTLSIEKSFVSDIRINYEQYFYRKDAVPKVSERNKFVVEFMTRF